MHYVITDQVPVTALEDPSAPEMAKLCQRMIVDVLELLEVGGEKRAKIGYPAGWVPAKDLQVEPSAAPPPLVETSAAIPAQVEPPSPSIGRDDQNQGTVPRDAKPANVGTAASGAGPKGPAPTQNLGGDQIMVTAGLGGLVVLEERKKKTVPLDAAEIAITVSRDAAASNPAPVRASRQPCKYGHECFQKNLAHRRNFIHPGDPDWPGAAQDVSAKGETKTPPEETEKEETRAPPPPSRECVIAQDDSAKAERKTPEERENEETRAPPSPSREKEEKCVIE